MEGAAVISTVAGTEVVTDWGLPPEPPDENPGHRRRGLHRLGRGPPHHPRHRLDRRQRRQADLRRQSRIAGRGARQQPPHAFQGRYLRPQGDRRHPAGLPARRRAASGGGEPCRPLDRRRRALHRDQCRRHLCAAGGGARLLAQARRAGAQRASASSTSRPTRCSARWARPAGSARPRPISPTRPTPPARPRPTTWCAPGTTPTACRRWPPTAPTITAPITSPRS